MPIPSAFLRRLAILALLLHPTVALVANGTLDAQDCQPGGPPPPEGFRRFANATIVINASAPAIWGVLANFSGWEAWNDVFITQMEGEPEVGKRFKVKSYMRTAPLMLRRTTVTMELSVMEESKKLCWQPQLPPGLKGEHCYVLCPTTSGTTVYNYEDHKGLFQPITRRVMGPATTDAFARFNVNLSAAVVHARRLSTAIFI